MFASEYQEIMIANWKEKKREEKKRKEKTKYKSEFNNNVQVHNSRQLSHLKGEQ